jgi:hypothetical protein
MRKDLMEIFKNHAGGEIFKYMPAFDYWASHNIPRQNFTFQLLKIDEVSFLSYMKSRWNMPEEGKVRTLKELATAIEYYHPGTSLYEPDNGLVWYVPNDNIQLVYQSDLLVINIDYESMLVLCHKNNFNPAQPQALIDNLFDGLGTEKITNPLLPLANSFTIRNVTPEQVKQYLITRFDIPVENTDSMLNWITQKGCSGLICDFILVYHNNNLTFLCPSDSIVKYMENHFYPNLFFVFFTMFTGLKIPLETLLVKLINITPENLKEHVYHFVTTLE